MKVSLIDIVDLIINGYIYFIITNSEMTPEGRRVTKLDEILLNGNNIAMLIPGGEYPLVELLLLVEPLKGHHWDCMLIMSSLFQR